MFTQYYSGRISGECLSCTLPEVKSTGKLASLLRVGRGECRSCDAQRSADIACEHLMGAGHNDRRAATIRA